MKRKPKTKPTMTDVLKATIRKSKMQLLPLSKATGVARASLIRFLRGDTSIRLDVADKLAEYFHLTLTSEKDTD